MLAHWVETGPWWQSTGARAVIGSEDAAAETETRGPRPRWATCSPSASCGGSRPAAAGLTTDGEPDGGGVFDLAFDWADGRWTLVGCTD